MKLNMDCVRDILLCVEENTGLRKMCIFVDSGLDESAKFVGNYREPMEYQNILCKLYDNDEIIYHLNYCSDAGLLVKSDMSSDYEIFIADLTPQGHEFLGNIRTKENWEKTKEIVKKIGASGLNMVIQIATGVATTYLKQTLGLS